MDIILKELTKTIKSTLGIDIVKNHLTRKSNVVDARKIYAYYAYTKLKNKTIVDKEGNTLKVRRLSLSVIGKHIKKDHASVLNYLKKTENHLEYDIEFKYKYESVVESFNNFKSFHTKEELRKKAESLLKKAKIFRNAYLNFEENVSV